MMTMLFLVLVLVFARLFLMTVTMGSDTTTTDCKDAAFVRRAENGLPPLGDQLTLV